MVSLASVVGPDGKVTVERGTPLRKELVRVELLEDAKGIADLFQRVQDNAAAAVDEALSVPFLQSGVLLREVSFTAGASKMLTHRLGRAFRGFLELNPTVAVPRAVRDTVQQDPTKWIQLTAAVTGIADIWVY